jgi:DNA repair photolyase
MAKESLAHVNLSVTTLDAELARTLEPRTATPAARLRAIAELTAAGVPVRAMVAPVIPGLNDREMPAILKAAREAGAGSAGYVYLRLPHSVSPIFRHWLAEHRPGEKDRIEGLIRASRGGKLNDPNFGSRMRGSGPYAEQIAQTFAVFSKRYGLDGSLPPLDSTKFEQPGDSSDGGQLRLF